MSQRLSDEQVRELNSETCSCPCHSLARHRVYGEDQTPKCVHCNERFRKERLEQAAADLQEARADNARLREERDEVQRSLERSQDREIEMGKYLATAERQLQECREALEKITQLHGEQARVGSDGERSMDVYSLARAALASTHGAPTKWSRCSICDFDFAPQETGLEICLTCLKTLRCINFVNTHKLCSCGDDFCVHNTNERRAKAEMLNRIWAASNRVGETNGKAK